MSLMRLLTLGRSLTTGLDSGRYKMAGKGVLPSFGTVRRFHQPHQPDALPGSEVPSRQAEPGLVEQAPVWEPPLESPVSPPRLLEPTLGAVEAMVWEQIREGPETEPTPDAGMLATVKDWLHRKKGASAKASPMKPDKPRSLVRQTLLSLDEVHVVRNDLTDADYDVQPAPASWVAPGTSEAPPSVPKPPLPGMAWSQAAARLFQSDRARI
jgi:hypothetical protein